MAIASEYEALIKQKEAHLTQLRQLKNESYRDRLVELANEEVERRQAELGKAIQKRDTLLVQIDNLYDSIDAAVLDLRKSKANAKLETKKLQLAKLAKLSEQILRAT